MLSRRLGSNAHAPPDSRPDRIATASAPPNAGRQPGPPHQAGGVRATISRTEHHQRWTGATLIGRAVRLQAARRSGCVPPVGRRRVARSALHRRRQRRASGWADRPRRSASPARCPRTRWVRCSPVCDPSRRADFERRDPAAASTPGAGLRPHVRGAEVGERALRCIGRPRVQGAVIDAGEHATRSAGSRSTPCACGAGRTTGRSAPPRPDQPAAAREQLTDGGERPRTVANGSRRFPSSEAFSRLRELGRNIRSGRGGI